MQYVFVAVLRDITIRNLLYVQFRNEDKSDILNNYFASVFIKETYKEVEEEAILSWYT